MNVAGSHRAMVLTPPGGGAIALIRVVGPNPDELMRRCFRRRSGRSAASQEHDRLRYGVLVIGDETIDDVIVCIHEVQGSPVVDISAHGGTRVISRVLETLESLGVAVVDREQEGCPVWAAANEIEREALQALGSAKTDRAVRFAAYQWQHLTDALRNAAETTRSDREGGLAVLRNMADRAAPARLILEGATVAIVGPANSGKSTLFNAIIGRNAALVSAKRGTTRDWVSESVRIHGVPIVLLDTAGTHVDAFGLEDEAVFAGREVGRTADIRILLLDGSAPQADNGVPLIRDFANDPSTLIAWSKSDLPCYCDISATVGVIAEPLRQAPLLSAATGDGISALMDSVASMLGVLDWDECVPALFTARQLKIASDILSSPESPPDMVEATLRRLIGE